MPTRARCTRTPESARVLAAIILNRPAVEGTGPWREAIAGGRRTVSIQTATPTGGP